jgi:hypothetical protein
VNLFARRCWLIVAGELALIGIGLGALRALGAPHQANVAWIALIVGLHFIAFRVAGLWGNIVVRAAAALVAFGLAGLGLAAASEAGRTSFVSGVLSGFVLLSGSIYALGTGVPDNRAGANPTSPAPARPTASAGAGGLARGHVSRSCRTHPFGILGPPTRSRTSVIIGRPGSRDEQPARAGGIRGRGGSIRDRQLLRPPLVAGRESSRPLRS